MMEVVARMMITIGALMVIGSVWTLRFVPAGSSSEQVMGALCLIIGGVAAVAGTLTLWRIRRHPPDPAAPTRTTPTADPTDPAGPIEPRHHR